MLKPGTVVVIGLFPVGVGTLTHALTMEDSKALSSGFMPTTCDECSARCWIGPEQRNAYECTPGPTALLCYSCVLFGQDITILKKVGPHETESEGRP